MQLTQHACPQRNLKDNLVNHACRKYLCYIKNINKQKEIFESCKSIIDVEGQKSDLYNYRLIVIPNSIYPFRFFSQGIQVQRKYIFTPRLSLRLFCNIASFTSKFPTSLREITPADDDSVKVVA